MSICCLKYENISCNHDACTPLQIDLGILNANMCVDIEISVRGETWVKEGVNTDANGILIIEPSWGVLKIAGKHIIGIYDCISGDVVNNTCYEVTTAVFYKKCEI